MTDQMFGVELYEKFGTIQAVEQDRRRDAVAAVLEDVGYVPAAWTNYDRCDGVTMGGAHYTVIHEIADALDADGMLYAGWFHRLTVTCDDPQCCPEAMVFTGADAWRSACTQLQDFIDFLNWK